MVTIVGLVLACTGDLPTGPAVIATYGGALVVVATGTYVLRAPRRVVALRNTVLVASAVGVAVAGLWVLGTTLGGAYRVETHAEPPVEGPVNSCDPMAEADAVVEALEVDPTSGVARAIEYLRGEPLPFYRERVVERLGSLMGKDPGLVVEEGMNSAANQRALRAIREHFGLE